MGIQASCGSLAAPLRLFDPFHLFEPFLAAARPIRASPDFAANRGPAEVSRCIDRGLETSAVHPGQGEDLAGRRPI